MNCDGSRDTGSLAGWLAVVLDHAVPTSCTNSSEACTGTPSLLIKITTVQLEFDFGEDDEVRQSQIWQLGR